jgi:predicted N-acyltransferase
MTAVKNNSNDYVIRVLDTALAVEAAAWNGLLSKQEAPTPFMRHEYLAALESSGSASPATGWTARFITLWRDDELHAACALYLKDHSYGEYVFDWAWANAYAEHGLAYYPKALTAVPFTPVPGTRLLARDGDARRVLVDAILAWCRQQSLSSFHLLFAAPDDVAACEAAGMMLRHTVQFHWMNSSAPTLGTHASSLPPEGARFALGEPGGETTATAPWTRFEDFLASLAQEKRKKIRQERRKVTEAGVVFRWSRGLDISGNDWDFFYRCYERTYYEHGNAPYLTREFFHHMAADMPDNWLLFVAERAGQPIAASLIALDSVEPGAHGPATGITRQNAAYGRYWGALERVDCLHFEACYYQPLQWCIEHGFGRFEGGAQGEHKMARALMPVKTTSCHWLAHPAFADAVERFLDKEGRGIENYLEHLDERSPFRRVQP